MSDAFVGLATSPLLPVYAFQHDLRERYMNALEEIVAAEVDGRSYKAAFEKVKAIASEAISVESIEKWVEQGRPLPKLDSVLGDFPQRLTTEVTSALTKIIKTAERNQYEG